MNEKFAVDPGACRGSLEWRYLFDKLGPFAGRYGLEFPLDWDKRVIEGAAGEGWQEIERLKVLLRRARESKQMIRCRIPTSYRVGRDWIDNFHLNQPLRSTVAAAVVRQKKGAGEIDIDNFDLPPTAGETVPSDVDTFVRVSEVLLLIAPELYFVDPFLDPTRGDRYDVLVRMLSVAAQGECQRVAIWCSERRVEADHQAIQRRLSELKATAKCNFKLVFNLVDDTSSAYKLHDRWLFTQYGGIGFGQGFQRQSRSRKMNVWPMDKSHFEDCWANLREGGADFKVRSVEA